MEALRWPALFGLLGLTVYLTTALDTTFVVERPIHTAVVFLVCIGTTLLLSYRSTSTRHRRTASDRELQNGNILRQPGFNHTEGVHKTLLRLLGAYEIFERSKYSIAVLSLALVARAESTYFILQHVECTGQTLQSSVPAVVAVGDLILAWQSQRFQSTPKMEKPHYASKSAQPDRRSHNLSIILTVLLISTSSTFAIYSFQPPRSTYICASSAPYIWMTPLTQHIATMIDSIIVLCISKILLESSKDGQFDLKVPARARGITLSFLSSAFIIAIAHLVHAAMVKGGLSEIAHLSSIYLISLAKMSLLISAASLCFTISLQHFGLLITTTLPTIAAVVTSTISCAKSSILMSPVVSLRPGLAFLAIAIMVLTSLMFLRICHKMVNGMHHSSRRSTGNAFLVLQLCVVAAGIAHMYLWMGSTKTSFTDSRLSQLENAFNQHKRYAASANASRSLFLAAEEYRSRYNRYPPPRFDAWYKYAIARDSIIIDAYDSIWQDIQPFYALDPAEIRTRTRDLIIDSRNDIAGVSIRDGRAYAGLHVAPRNQWMIEGMVKMINKFAEHLPDMDLAINMNDANRVAVPYERLQYLQHTGQPPKQEGVEPQNQFQPGRATHWPRLSGSERKDVVEELSSHDNIFRFVTAGCPSNSTARREHFWNVKYACSACSPLINAASESFDICSQPDLQHLHGLYSSPAVFKATRKLYPVFSAAKAPGFNDILYPSMWDYLDKTVYAPSRDHPDLDWANKTNDVFWRGSTTEGMSYGKGGLKWQGMLRQRFVHFINNIKGSAPPAILQLTDKSSSRYVSVPASDIGALLKTDIKLAPEIARCQGRDCDLQRWEFAPSLDLVDFQDQWSHKYLLDMDGATASTRFLPFLRSRSLPLRAGIIQEWWHDRVVPWVHYVPLDVRGHDFWSTLLWFTGIRGTVNGQHIDIDGHEAEAERIAIAGRDWADVALRKEDVEIYFFRLLLEWARVTDDWRDDIGFTGVN